MNVLKEGKGQPYISWKGNSTNSVVPSWSRPLQGTETYSTGPDFKARPIKHWRKQLMPIANSGNGNSAIGTLTAPGSEVFLGKSNINHCASCSETNAVIIKSVHGNEKTNDLYIYPEDLFYDNVKEKNVCVSCNPEANIIKTATSIISKKYFQDRLNYLKSRNNTYEQNITGVPKDNIQYLDGNQIIWPSNSSTGTQNFNSFDNCGTSGTKSNVIYKPNNVQYSCQGAVNASDRLLRLKMNTINKNGASMLNAWGASAANASSYHSGSITPYFMKSKNEPNCVNYRRNGVKNKCL